MKSSLQIGFARADITPPLGTHLCGYPVLRPADAVNDALQANVLVLRQGETKVALISLDWISIEEADVETIRRGVFEATAIAPENVTVCATHTHSGPTTMTAWGWGDKETAWIGAMLPRIVDAVGEAHERLQNAHVGIATTRSDVGINRREVMADGTVGFGSNFWGTYDPTMTVARFQGENARGEAVPLATFVHYGAHPTALGRLACISRDWPGVMSDRIEELTGAPVIFINGALGDVAPRGATGSATRHGIIGAREVGLRAAAHAMGAYASIKEWRDLELAVCNKDIALPHAPLPSLQEARAQLAASDGEAQWGEPFALRRYWQAVIEAHAKPVQSHRVFAQTITQLGPLVIVPFAGEPFAEIALRLRQTSPFAHTLCAGTTNGKQGYYVTREARARGGYEVWVARAYGAYLLADDIDDVLVAQNAALLQKLQDAGV